MVNRNEENVCHSDRKSGRNFARTRVNRSLSRSSILGFAIWSLFVIWSSLGFLIQCVRVFKIGIQTNVMLCGCDNTDEQGSCYCWTPGLSYTIQKFRWIAHFSSSQSDCVVRNRPKNVLCPRQRSSRRPVWHHWSRTFGRSVFLPRWLCTSRTQWPTL